jgi:segregation and condensation protein A
VISADYAEYNIKLKVFEGPIALLLHLIEKDKLDIYDIPIAVVTEQYLAYIKALEEFNIEVASEFLVMAATLLQIKSRMLLPKPPKVNELAEEELDPRQELVARLIEYRKYKELSCTLETMLKDRQRYFTRLPQEFDKQFTLPEGLSLDHLLRAIAAVWESVSPELALVTREEISVQDKMQDILHLLHKNGGQIEFSATLIRTGTRTEIIVAFLALLELMRLKRITIMQNYSFAPIQIILKTDEEVKL